MSNAMTSGKTYTLTIDGSGGSYLIGSISPEAAKYWRDEGPERLSEYLQKPSGMKNIDPAYTLSAWRNNCDLLNQQGIAYIESVSVEDQNGDVVFAADGGEIDSIIVRDENDEIENLKFTNAVAIRSHEKGLITYTFSSENTFDSDKLMFHQIDLLDEEIVTMISYDKTELVEDEWFSKHYADIETKILGQH